MTALILFGKGLPRGGAPGGLRFARFVPSVRFASFVIGLGTPIRVAVIHLLPAISELSVSARVMRCLVRILIILFMDTLLASLSVQRSDYF
jgi:hypothetical protein